MAPKGTITDTKENEGFKGAPDKKLLGASEAIERASVVCSWMGLMGDREGLRQLGGSQR